MTEYMSPSTAIYYEMVLRCLQVYYQGLVVFHIIGQIFHSTRNVEYTHILERYRLLFSVYREICCTIHTWSPKLQVANINHIKQITAKILTNKHTKIFRFSGYNNMCCNVTNTFIKYWHAMISKLKPHRFIKDHRMDWDCNRLVAIRHLYVMDFLLHCYGFFTFKSGPSVWICRA